jgi:LysM repeat protein
MGTWKKWQQVESGPFQGKPEFYWHGQIGGESFSFMVRDGAGNMLAFVPAVPGATGGLINWGGAGIIAHLPPPAGPYAMVVRGLDNGLYALDFENGKWLKYSGPGRLLSDAAFLGSHDGSQQILGEGIDHQLAYCYISNDERPRLEANNWQDLGRPGESGGKKGINGRPAVVRGMDGIHVFVRGQDNHLWHISKGYGAPPGQLPKFGNWTNLGGRLTSVPVAIFSGNMNDKIECFVIGEDNALWTITGDGQNWTDFQNLGGQLKGLPTAANTFTGDSTFVFGRGVHDKLWYRRRNGTAWQRWQSLDGQLTSDPAVILERTIYGGARLICMALGQKGALWERVYQITRGEYGDTTSGVSTVTYTVQAGDWIYRIGRALDVSVNDIKKANSQIRNFDRIHAGDKLSIPVKKREGRLFYIIQQDDNLSRISKAFGVTVDDLKRENNIQNADRIYTGATLTIPV